MWHAELRPGFDCAMLRHVPSADTIGDHDVAIRVAASHMSYIQPGERRALPAIALAPYRGTWHQGADVYKGRDAYARLAHLPTWAREPHAWQQIQMNSPEDELRFRFAELTEVAKESTKHGVKAIQLVGWNDGGQDQGNPSHDPDPRLGTPEELKTAIAACHALGVKIVLFAKFTWADRATAAFREDLHRLAVKDPYGDCYVYEGYRYQTQEQLSGIGNKRLVPMCFLAEEYLELCQVEFRKMVALGAAGILFDECMHHNPTLACFDTDHGHRYGASTYANDNRLIRDFSREVDDEFLFAGEACYDGEFEVYPFSYFRTEAPRHIPLQRYLRPEAAIATALTGFNDRNMVNQCLLYRYVISYEPFNFKGRLDDYPDTIAYGKQMDALRTELREYVWDGLFRHELGGRATLADGAAHHPYSVYERRGDGHKAMVVANYDLDKAVTVTATIDDGQPLTHMRHVGETESKPFDGTVTLPAQSAAVVW